MDFEPLNTGVFIKMTTLCRFGSNSLALPPSCSTNCARNSCREEHNAAGRSPELHENSETYSCCTEEKWHTPFSGWKMNHEDLKSFDFFNFFYRSTGVHPLVCLTFRGIHLFGFSHWQNEVFESPTPPAPLAGFLLCEAAHLGDLHPTTSHPVATSLQLITRWDPLKHMGGPKMVVFQNGWCEMENPT